MTNETLTKEVAGKMVDIRLEETSGVDDPAHLVPGWIVMKAKEAPVEDVAEEAEELAKNHINLLTALESADYLRGRGVPDPVIQAYSILLQYLRTIGNDTEDEYPDITPESQAELNLGKEAPEVEKAIEDVIELIEKHRGRSARGRLWKLEEAARTLRELYENLARHDHEETEEVQEVSKDETTVEETPTEEAVAKAEETPAEAAVEPAAEAATEEAVTKSEEPVVETPAAPAIDLSSITNAIAALADKVEKSLGDINTKMDEASAKTDSLVEKVEGLDSRVETVEKARNIRKGLDGQDGGDAVKKSVWSGALFPRTNA